MENTLPELPSLAALESPDAGEPSARPKTNRLRPIIPPVEEPVLNTAPVPFAPPAAEQLAASPLPPPATEAPALIPPPTPKFVQRVQAPVIELEPTAAAEPERDLAAEKAAAVAAASKRLLSLDAFRGAIMLLMASGGLGISQIAKSMPADSWWAQASEATQHISWSGCHLWDLIQPAFMFMVGMAMPFSYDKRLARGDSTWRLFDHALFRSIALVLLGVLLSSKTADGQTNWTFTNVLSQIGLGYTVLFFLWRLGTWAQVLGIFAILVGYSAWFAQEPLTPEFDYSKTMFKPEDLFAGPFAAWNPLTNAAAHFDQWFLNLFPRKQPFVLNDGGYQTLNFIPSIATMTLGLLIGRFIRSDRDAVSKTFSLLFFGVALLGLGYLVGETLCPVVKRIWTPSWVLFSGGFVILMLAGFYGVIEMMKQRWLGWPLAIVGMNSIFVYLAAQWSKGWIKEQVHLHFPKEWFTGTYAPLIDSASVLLVIWLLCLWLYRQRAFLRL